MKRIPIPHSIVLKQHNKPLIIAAILIAAIAFGLRSIIRTVSGFSDSYRQIMVPLATNTLGRLMGVLPFSVAECLLLLLLFLLVLSLLWCFFPLLSPVFHSVTPGSSIGVAFRVVKKRFSYCTTRILLILSIVFLIFEGGQDVYLYATPFSEVYNIGQGQYTTEELYETCVNLAERVNTLSHQVSRNENGIMIHDADLQERTAKLMTELGESYPLLQGYYPTPKPILCSVVLSETNITGVYSAYTVEANYNRLMPDYNVAFTMCHELSHLQGILQENEANFIAYLATSQSEDADIAYSGAMLGWVYCGNELYKRDKSLWQEVSSVLSDEVRQDLDDNNAYWARYKSKVSETAESLNDAYLKQGGQSAGTLSYSQVVDLIVAYEHSIS